jgi:hypothetical protein
MRNRHVTFMAFVFYFKRYGGENVDHILLSFHSKFIKYFV